MAYLSSSTNAGNSATPSTAVPAGVAAGTIVLLACSVDNTAAAFDTADWPAGFTELDEVGTTADGQRMAVGWKRATGADTGSYTFGNLGASGDWVCQAVALTGRHATSPPVVSTAAINNTLNATPVTVTANGVTAVAGDDLAWVSAPDTNAGNNGAGHTPPAGYTERQDAMSGWTNLSVATVDNVAAGATGSVSGTFALIGGSARAGWASWLVRVPAAAGGVDTTDTARVGGLAWSGVRAVGAADVTHQARVGGMAWGGVGAVSTSAASTTHTARVGGLQLAGVRATSTADVAHTARVGGMAWGGVAAASTAAPPGTVSHIFTTQVPDTSAGDAQVTVGVAFTVDTAGSATGARVHTGGATGYQSKTISAGLWDAAGTLLATGSATTAADQGNGWFEIPFDSPTILSPGQTYTVGINTGAGSGYAYTASGLAAAIDNAPLHTAATAGRFDYGALAKPTTTTGTNFFVDVSFTAGSVDTTDTARVGGLAWGGVQAQAGYDVAHTARVGGVAWGGVAPVLSLEDVVEGTGPGTMQLGGIRATSTAGTTDTARVGGLAWSGVRAVGAADVTHQARVGGLAWSGVRGDSTTLTVRTDTARVGGLQLAGVRATSTAGLVAAPSPGGIAWSGIPARRATSDATHTARVGGLQLAGVRATSTAASRRGHHRGATLASYDSTRAAVILGTGGTRTAIVLPTEGP